MQVLKPTCHLKKDASATAGNATAETLLEEEDQTPSTLLRPIFHLAL